MLFNTNENSISQQVIINKADIEVNKSNISRNSTDIEVNKSNISQNSTDIEVNKSNISQNSTDIEDNKANISQNSTDIEDNKANISRNSTDIKTLDTRVAYLEAVDGVADPASIVDVIQVDESNYDNLPSEKTSFYGITYYQNQILLAYTYGDLTFYGRTVKIERALNANVLYQKVDMINSEDNTDRLYIYRAYSYDNETWSEWYREPSRDEITSIKADIDAVKKTADSALSKTEYDEFVTIAALSNDYVTIPDITTYKRLEIQYAGRISATGDYAYLTNSVVQMSPETTENFQPFASLVWSSSTWSHIGGVLRIELNRFYPIITTISRGTVSSSTYISYGIKVTIRCYK